MTKKTKRKPIKKPKASPVRKASQEVKNIMATQQASDMVRDIERDIEAILDPFYEMVKDIAIRSMMENHGVRPALYALDLSGDVSQVDVGKISDNPKERSERFVEIGKLVADDSTEIVAFASVSEAWLSSSGGTPSTAEDRQEALTVSILTANGKARIYAALIRRGIDMKVVALDDSEKTVYDMNSPGWRSAYTDPSIPRSEFLELVSLSYAKRVAEKSVAITSMDQVRDFFEDIIKKNGV